MYIKDEQRRIILRDVFQSLCTPDECTLMVKFFADILPSNSLGKLHDSRPRMMPGNLPSIVWDCDTLRTGTRPLDFLPNPFYITFVPETPHDFC